MLDRVNYLLHIMLYHGSSNNISNDYDDDVGNNTNGNVLLSPSLSKMWRMQWIAYARLTPHDMAITIVI